MNKIFLISAVAVLIHMTLCAQIIPNTDQSPSDKIVFDSAPGYSITITEKSFVYGRAWYYSKSFTSDDFAPDDETETVSVTGRFSRDSFLELATKIKNSGFFALPKEIGSSFHGRYYPLRITVKFNGQTHEVLWKASPGSPKDPVFELARKEICSAIQPLVERLVKQSEIPIQKTRATAENDAKPKRPKRRRLPSATPSTLAQ